MTYGDFVDSLGYGCQLFYNTLISVANMLIHNYIFITLLGLSIFLSLIYFLFNIIHIPYFLNNDKNLDNRGNGK